MLLGRVEAAEGGVCVCLCVCVCVCGSRPQGSSGWEVNTPDWAEPHGELQRGSPTRSSRQPGTQQPWPRRRLYTSRADVLVMWEVALCMGGWTTKEGPGARPPPNILLTILLLSDMHWTPEILRSVSGGRRVDADVGLAASRVFPPGPLVEMPRSVKPRCLPTPELQVATGAPPRVEISTQEVRETSSPLISKSKMTPVYTNNSESCGFYCYCLLALCR